MGYLLERSAGLPFEHPVETLALIVGFGTFAVGDPCWLSGFETTRQSDLRFHKASHAVPPLCTAEPVRRINARQPALRRQLAQRQRGCIRLGSQLAPGKRARP